MRQRLSERRGTELAVRKSDGWSWHQHTDEKGNAWDRLEKELFPSRSPTSAIVDASPPSAIAVASPPSDANAGKLFTEAEMDALGDATVLAPSPAEYKQFKKRKKEKKGGRKKRRWKRKLADAKKEVEKTFDTSHEQPTPVLDKVEEAPTPTKEKANAKCKATPQKAAAPCKAVADKKGDKGVAQKEKGKISKPDQDEPDVVKRYLKLTGISIATKRHRMHSNVYEKERKRVFNFIGDDNLARSRARTLAMSERGRFDAEVKRLNLSD